MTLAKNGRCLGLQYPYGIWEVMVNTNQDF